MQSFPETVCPILSYFTHYPSEPAHVKLKHLVKSACLIHLAVNAQLANTTLNVAMTSYNTKVKISAKFTSSLRFSGLCVPSELRNCHSFCIYCIIGFFPILSKQSQCLYVQYTVYMYYMYIANYKNLNQKIKL